MKKHHHKFKRALVCVQRKSDGRRVWRSVDSDGEPLPGGGSRWAHPGDLDAEDFAPGTRITKITVETIVLPRGSR